MTGRLLALALIATAPFPAPDVFHPGAASGVTPRPEGRTGWSTTRDGLVAIGHRTGGGTTYFIDAASLADVTFTIGATPGPQAALTDATQPGALLTPGLTLVLNRSF